MLPNYIRSRLLFPRGKQRLFVERVFEKSGLNAKSLSIIVGVSPRTIRDWKREEFNISEKAVSILSNSFDIPLPKNIDKLKNDWLRTKLETCRKGAVVRYKKYGDFGTPEGRKKGGSNALKIMREKGIIAPFKNFSPPAFKDANLAEFFGIMLGDGGLTKFQATITLNSEADKNYIKYVRSLGIQLFNDKPSISLKKDCKATDLRFSGIKLVEYLVNLGLQTGDKVKNQVTVPQWIQNSKSFRIACLRGLMDTDGCIVKVTHKYKSRKYTYFNPCFANRSKPLLSFVTNTLIGLGLHPSVAGERVWLYNKAEVRAYFELIGSHNTRLLKYQVGSHSWSIAEVR